MCDTDTLQSHITRLQQIDDMYDELFTILKTELHKYTLSITMDAAETAAGQSVQAYTAHWIDEAWVMRTALLDLQHMTDKHTGEYIDELLAQLLSSLQIDCFFACTNGTERRPVMLHNAHRWYRQRIQSTESESTGPGKPSHYP